MTMCRVWMALGYGALVPLVACSDSDAPASSAAASVTIDAPVETDGLTEATIPSPSVDIEIGAADTSVVGGFELPSGSGSLISRRFQITNHSDVALQGALSLNVGCPVDGQLTESMPADAGDLSELDISAGDVLSLEAGASTEVFAVPIVVPDAPWTEGAPCSDGSSPVVLLNVTELLQGDPPPTVSGTTMVVPADAAQTFVVMEPVAEAING